VISTLCRRYESQSVDELLLCVLYSFVFFCFLVQRERQKGENIFLSTEDYVCWEEKKWRWSEENFITLQTVRKKKKRDESERRDSLFVRFGRSRI
jgi:hypothetical protein